LRRSLVRRAVQANLDGHSILRAVGRRLAAAGRRPATKWRGTKAPRTETASVINCLLPSRPVPAKKAALQPGRKAASKRKSSEQPEARQEEEVGGAFRLRNHVRSAGTRPSARAWEMRIISTAAFVRFGSRSARLPMLLRALTWRLCWATFASEWRKAACGHESIARPAEDCDGSQGD
jgi:hypothetical protein